MTARPSLTRAARKRRRKHCNWCAWGVAIEYRNGIAGHLYRQQIDKQHDTWEECWEKCCEGDPAKRRMPQ